MSWVILLVVFLPNYVLSTNILYLNSMPTLSHHTWNEVLIKGLVQNGHNVTMIGYYDASIQSANYTALKINYTIDYAQLHMDVILNGGNSPIGELRLFWDFIDTVYKSDSLKTLLDYPRDAFDLIVFDVTYAYFYPLIEQFGNPLVVAVSPFNLPPYISNQILLWQRLLNYGLYLTEYVWEYRSNLMVEEKAKERFGPGISTLPQVQKRFTVLLANYPPILDLGQPLPSPIIPIGGLLVKSSADLSEDLQKILDASYDGVIFFSFGSDIRWSLIPDEIRKAFLAAFSKMKQTILWKYDQEDLGNLPKNIVIRKWFPQSIILKHKNVKLLITHGDCLSSHEAVYHGVPVLGIPFLVDQKNNIARMEAKMVGRLLELSDITEGTLAKTISEILDNLVYAQRMRKYSEAYRSREETPVEMAVSWIELVLKGKDLSHLWPKAEDMNFWERENFDIYVFLSLVLTYYYCIIRIV